MYSPKNILALEDDKVTGTLLQKTLTSAGHNVRWVEDAESFFRDLKVLCPDIVIVDNVPGSPCPKTCSHLYLHYQHQLPRIIVYSGSESEEDIVSYYKSGASDYISKRYSPKVLLSRIEALTKIAGVQSKERRTLRWNNLLLSPSSKKAELDGVSVSLTPSEFELLYLLVSRSGKIFTRKEIISEMRDLKFTVSERTVDVFITCIRKKLGLLGTFVQTVRGVGYTFHLGDSAIEVVDK